MAKRKGLELQSPDLQAKRQKVDDKADNSAEESSNTGSGKETVPYKIASDLGVKSPKKLRGKKQPRAKSAQDDTNSTPNVRTISKSVQAKVQQVLRFNAKSPSATCSALERDGDNRDHVTVTELAAIAAIMRMRSDYEVSDPILSSLKDIKKILVYTFERRMGNYIGVEHVVVDLSKRSSLEDFIHTKAEGHGLAEIGLLEAELEMLAHDTEAAAANDLFRHMETVYEESDSSGAESVSCEEVVEQKQDEEIELMREPKEIARAGVCPAPLMDA